MTGAELIAKERERQKGECLYSPEYDIKENRFGALALAAACYALPQKRRNCVKYAYIPRPIPELWPWDWDTYKPTEDDRISELVRAGALIAAEIDRLQAMSLTRED